MVWEHEQDFRALLKDITKKASKEHLDLIAELAVSDAVAYKIVCALLLKELKQVKPDYRIKIIFAMSSIVRLSVSRHATRDKYSKSRLQKPLAPTSQHLTHPTPLSIVTSLQYPA
jgi:hypothetical protein